MSSCSPISVLNFSQMSLSSSGSPRTEISFDNLDISNIYDRISKYIPKNSSLGSSGSPTSYVNNVLNINLGKLKTSSSLNSIFDFSYKKTSLDGSVSQESILNKFSNFNFLNIHNSSSPKDYSAQFNYFDKLEGENEKIKNFLEKRYDWEGNVWSKNFGNSIDYIKSFIDESELHIHAPNGFITGANLRGKNEICGSPVSNYEAAMLDLFSGVIHKEKNKW